MNDELQRTDSWYEQRLGKFTASNFGTLMSYPFKKTAMALILDKYMESITGKREELSNIYMDWGTENEPKGIARYEKETCLKVVDVGFVPMPGYERFAGGSPDGLIYENDKLVGIIECKCPHNPVNFSKAINEDGIPSNSKRAYYTQIQFNMLATGAEWCDWFSYEARTDRIFIKRYARDEEYISKIKEQLDRAIEVLKDLSSNEATPEQMATLKKSDSKTINEIEREEKLILKKAWPGLDEGACEGLSFGN